MINDNHPYKHKAVQKLFKMTETEFGKINGDCCVSIIVVPLPFEVFSCNIKQEYTPVWGCA